MVEMAYWNEPWRSPSANFTGVEDYRILGTEISEPRNCERRWYIYGKLRKMRSLSGITTYYATSNSPERFICFKHLFDEWFEHLTDEEKEVVIWNWDVWNNDWEPM